MLPETRPYREEFIAISRRPRGSDLITPINLLHVLPSFDIGGSQRRMIALAAGLGAEFLHTVVAIDGSHEASILVPPGTPIRYAAIRLTRSRGVSLGNLVRAHRLLRAERPRLLLTYNWGAIEVAFANRLGPHCPHLHCEDGFAGAAAQGPEPRRRALARRLSLGPASRLVVPSRGLEELARSVWGIPAAHIIRIPNGIDTRRFCPPPAARAAGRSAKDGGIVVGTLTRLSAEKNVDRLLRAFARLPSDGRIVLMVAGEGPDRQSLESASASLGLDSRVTFTGRVVDAAEALRGFDVFAVTSDSEQMPFSVLEAMACGLPIVATDVGEIQDMVSDENRSFVVPRADEAAFADSLRSLNASAELRLALGAANRRKAERLFDERTMIARYRDLIRVTLGD